MSAPGLVPLLYWTPESSSGASSSRVSSSASSSGASSSSEALSRVADASGAADGAGAGAVCDPGQPTVAKAKRNRAPTRFHYRNLDVTTLKILAQLWRPELEQGFVKSGAHLALDDIRESIAELRYFRETFLK